MDTIKTMEEIMEEIGSLQNMEGICAKCLKAIEASKAANMFGKVICSECFHAIDKEFDEAGEILIWVGEWA